MLVVELNVLITQLLHQQMEERKAKLTHPLSRMLRSTQDYLDVFARFKQKENIEAVERLLSTQTHPLESFERSQLGKWTSAHRTRSPTSLHFIGTLCCETAEEAKTLVPSLANKIADQDLQDLLDEITKLRTFVD